MARGERRNADYFPFYCKEGKTTKYIDQTYGNDGFSVWVRILRQLTVTNYHYLDLSTRRDWIMLCSECKVSEQQLRSIINDLVDFGEFDSDLWNMDQVIWSDKFIDSIEDAYKNRKNKIVKKQEFIQLYTDLTGKKLISAGITSVSYPQSKEEKSKEEKTRVETSPIPDEVEFVFTKKATDLIDAICEYFSVKKIVASKLYDSICDYVSTIGHRNELDIAALALTKYMAYKARSQEQIHGPEKWIGTKDKHYRDGVWIAIDWNLKEKNYKNGTNSRQNNQGITPAASTTIESGKSFGDIRSHRANR